MNKLHFFVILSFFPLIPLTCQGISNKLNQKGGHVRFNIKKLLDSIVYSVMFIFLAYSHYVLIELEASISAIYIPIIECIIFSIIALSSFTSQFIFFSNPTYPLNRKTFPMILVSLLIGVLMALSTINYAIYVIWPSFYEIPSGLTFGEIVFEFVYYTFTLAVTYSSSSIVVTHITTKTIQIIEICYCYTIIGSVIIQLIDQIKSSSEVRI